MKKLISLLLIFSLLLMPGCASDPPEQTEEYPFYYRRSDPGYLDDDSVVGAEIRSVTFDPEDMSSLFAAYFEGPETRNLESPFPRGTGVISWSLSDDTLMLNLSEPFAALTGIELSIACGCIARTFLGIVNVRTVTLQVMHNTLDGRNFLELSRNNLHFSDDSLEQLSSDYNVYYVDPHWRYLIPMETSVSLANPDDIVRFLILRLMTTPFNSDLVAPLPNGTKLLDVTIKNEVCTLDFSQEFESNAWTRPEAQRLTLLSIVNTVTQVEGIRLVEFCTEGNLLVQYGSLNISAPFEEEDRAIGALRAGINEFDATFYVSNGSEDCLIGIPAKLRQTTGKKQEELILDALIHTPAVNGFYTTIPSGTVVNDVVTQQGTCYIDLSSDFLTSPATLEESVRAIVASVCTVAGVDRVQLTINGKIPGNVSSQLFGVLSPKSEWFG